MDWADQINELQNNSHLKTYFENENKNLNLTDFIIDSIHLNDLILNLTSNFDKDPLIDKLNSIENSTESETIKQLLDIIKLQVKTPNNNLNDPVLNNINNNLQLLQQNFSGSSASKGAVAENILFNNLIQLFPDTDIINTSNIPNSGDIQIKKDNKPVILIDSKNFKNNVGKVDLDKFYKDIQTNNCSGILCNSNSGIANRKHFEIDIKDNNILIFISNHQYDNTLFKLAVEIIYNIHDIIKDNPDNIELSKELFSRLKIEYNFFLSTFQQHLSAIKTNIVSLEKLAFIQLDQFFKRTNFNTELKPFSCQMCASQFGSDKTLKAHLKTKHQINLAKPQKKSKGKEVTVEIEVEKLVDVISFD